MSDDEKKKLPKGGRRGGKVIPHYALEEALAWSEKLVSKTHTAAQPLDLIKSSVVEAKSGTGDIRASALRQYGLLSGPSTALNATPLARQIKSAPSDEQRELTKQAALRPEVFNGLFKTFHGDTVPIGKLRQRAAELGVHPDTAAKCAEVYASTLIFAGLAERDGENIKHLEAQAVTDGEPGDAIANRGTDADAAEDAGQAREQGDAVVSVTAPVRRGAAAVQVNINLDSTLDTDKLEKQLALLRRFGAL